MPEPQYSIVIPVYNEAKRIPESIGSIFDFFGKRPDTFEFIFVNDGSTDATLTTLDSFKGKYDFKVVSYERNRGKGYAVKQGALASKGKWVFFFDIDLATPLETFDVVVSKLNNGDKVIIGSRRLSESKIERSESKIRTFLGQGFTKLSNLLVPGITDFTCGFKSFSREAVEIIFPRARIDRWGFDTELLYIAYLHKLSIGQVPVSWKHDDRSKVKVFQSILSSLRELIEMKINQLRGLYK